ncbi:expressed unknown protein [Seminavis robusta]|uniref:Uncharacterized protein n=1 Tax=Seminavis robusta TaxID=568900 RepID=A0A9N8DE65_9STRA|nr:expressed unknown protein [Seminavis robusta]|eukprot:Sro81_g043560.1 n/a (547) ;mRNA; f:95611-97251
MFVIRQRRCGLFLVGATCFLFGGTGNTNAFSVVSTTTGTVRPSSTCVLHETPKNNPFQNGGYDPSDASAAQWSPLEAAEFVIFHDSDPATVGRQLTHLVAHWSGRQVGEFVSRLYVGAILDDNAGKVQFESKHVRCPQWQYGGLDSPVGRHALKELLGAAVPDAVLEDPKELLQLAQSFLWKQFTWPAKTTNTYATTPTTATSNKTTQNKKKNKQKLEAITKPILESDSFANQGYTWAIIQIWKELGQERSFDISLEEYFTAENVLDVAVDLQQQNNHKDATVLLLDSKQLADVQEFFDLLQVQVTPAEKINIVQGLAKASWHPTTIAKFVSILSPTPVAHERTKVEKKEHMLPPPPQQQPQTTTTTKSLHETRTAHSDTTTTHDRIRQSIQTADTVRKSSTVTPATPTSQKQQLQRESEPQKQPRETNVRKSKKPSNNSAIDEATSKIQQRIQQADAARKKLEQQLASSSSSSSLPLFPWSTVPPKRDAAVLLHASTTTGNNNSTMDGLPFFGVSSDYFGETTTTTTTTSTPTSTVEERPKKPWQ